MLNMSQNKPMSIQDFIALGMQDVAYVKPAAGGRASPSLRSTPPTAIALAALETRELAFAVVRQNGLEPVSVH